MIEPRADRPTAITLGADKAYDAEDFINALRSMNVTPHVAQNTRGRSSAVDGRTTRLVMPPASASASALRRHSAGSRWRWLWLEYDHAKRTIAAGFAATLLIGIAALYVDAGEIIAILSSFTLTVTLIR